MNCPRCRNANPSEADFCGACGVPLRLACPACRRPNPSRNRFCYACGATLPAADTSSAGAELLASVAARVGERKRLTVLFADLCNSMGIIARRDPEDARHTLDAVLQRLIDAVHRYGGTVNQVMGDGIMALFGAPVAQEDHALRACAAALQMRVAIADYARDAAARLGVDLQLRVGLHSGEVVVRALASDLRSDYSAVGQATHIAARMEQMAEPGVILLTAETARLVEGRVPIKPRGAVPVKGLPDPVAIYEISGPISLRPTLARVDEREATPFVGREAQLKGLEQALAAAASARGQVVAVIGGAGVGKTRLLWEFLRLPIRTGWRVVESACLPYGRMAGYLPVATIVQALLDIDEPASATDTAAALDTALGGGAAGRLRAPVMALLFGASDDAEWQMLEAGQRRQRTRDAVRQLVVRATERQPLCLVIEDLQWIDAETQEVLDDLVDALAMLRVLLIVSYRPEYDHAWTRKPHYTQMAIEPLSREDAEEFARHLLGAGPDMAGPRSLLVERTEGNPFFLEETVRHLEETGVLRGARGAHRLSMPLKDLDVPETVHAVLAARVDRLAPEDKRVLQVAAAIGKDVPGPLLQAIAGTLPADLTDCLERLCARELLRRVRVPPVAEYSFVHALTHEVAYGMLVREQRRVLDRRIVEAMESRQVQLPDAADRLARHAVRGELPERAVRYCREAGARMFARSAPRAAATYFEQALTELAALPRSRAAQEEAIDLRLDLRSALLPLGEYRRLFAALTEAQAIAVDIGDPTRLSLVSAFLANYHTLRGELAHAIEHGEQALRLAEELGDRALRVPANAFLSLACFGVGDYRRAASLAERNIAATADAPTERFGMALLPCAYSGTVLAWARAELGEFEGACAAAEAGLALAQAAGHPHSVIFAGIGLGTVRLKRGEFTEAISVLERAETIRQEWDLPPLFLELAAPLASAYARAGRADHAIALLERAVSLAISLRHRYGHVLGSAGLAEAYLCAGRPKDALPRARMFVEITRVIGARGSEAWALHLLAEILAEGADGEPDEGETALRGALARARELGMRPLEGRCRLELGRLYCRCGLVDRARDEIVGARALFGELGMTTWAGRADRELARVIR